VRAYARALGLDLVGFAAVAELETELTEAQRPSTLAHGMKTFIVVAKRTLRGVTWARHLPSKQLAGGATCACSTSPPSRSPARCEQAGRPALPISPPPSTSTARPARSHAGRAGIDPPAARRGRRRARTWGLNLMVLTPELGPRIHSAA
jgi:hypothetical protein